MKNNIIITIVIAIIFGIFGFFIGTKYQSKKTSSFASSPFGNFSYGRFGNRQNSNSQITNQLQNGNRRNGPQMVTGEILTQDDKSITVKMEDGSSKIIFITNSTILNKSSAATKTDLKVGEKVAIFGLENSDGSVTANNIQLNPIARQTVNGGTPGQ